MRILTHVTNFYEVLFLSHIIFRDYLHHALDYVAVLKDYSIRLYEFL